MNMGVLHRDVIGPFAKKLGNNFGLMESIIQKRISSKPEDPEHLSPENFSFREMAEALGGDIRPHSGQPVFREAVGASQFSTIVGVLISTQVMEAYQKYTAIVDQLVTKFTSTMETDKVPGAYLAGSLEDVGEGAPYPHTADVKEKYVEIGHQKRGLILDVTDEAVRFDRTGLVLREAAKLGEKMGRDRESRIMKIIQDVTGYKAWYPSGTQEDLYQNAAGSDTHTYDNLVTDVLADYTDVNSLWTLLRLMKDDNGDPIDVMPNILLVPVALQVVASRIIMNDVLAGGNNNEMNVLKAVLPSNFKVLAHPDLDTQDSCTWYLGDFQRQFVEKVVIPPQVVTRRYGDNNEDAWRKDIVASYKARYDSKVGATDYAFVGKSTGG